MAMVSWMSHEEKRATKIKKLMAKERNEPLMIQAEPTDPMALISAHQCLVDNPQSVPKYINEQAQAIAHLEDMRDCLEMTACMPS